MTGMTLVRASATTPRDQRPCARPAWRRLAWYWREGPATV